MWPFLSKTSRRRTILVVGSTSFFLVWSCYLNEASAALENCDRYNPNYSDGTPFEEPEYNPSIPNDTGGIQDGRGGGAGGERTKGPKDGEEESDSRSDSPDGWIRDHFRTLMKWLIKIRRI